MLCKYPILLSKKQIYKNRPDILQSLGDELPGVPVPCGQCLACRINKRRKWTLRLLLEASQHAKASFVSLTYAPEHLPFRLDTDGLPQGVLQKVDVQLFMKRLRKKFDDRRVRFYACGEYGPNNTHRPHYHIILFGVSAEELDPDWFYFAGKSGPITKTFCRRTVLYNLWLKGVVHVGEVTPESIAYVAGYVTSKLTRPKDGREPEFALMSRMPGIGLPAIADIARLMQKVSQDSGQPINPRQIRANGHLWPTGRYLLSVLGHISDIRTGTEEHLASLVCDYRTAQEQNVDFLSYLLDKNEQALRNLEKREQLFRKRKDL